VIQEHPPNVLSLERVTADVVDDRGGNVDDPMPGKMKSPGQIDFFHVGEEGLVEGAHFVENLLSNEHANTARPEDLDRLVVLPFVDLDIVHQPAAGERVTIDIHQASGCTGIFELRRFAQRTDLGLAGRNRWILLRCLREFAHTGGIDLRIVVQQHHILAARDFDSTIATARVALIFIEVKDPDVREFPLGLDHAAVAGGVVDQYDFEFRFNGTRVERGEALNQDFGARIMRDDDAD